jgi:hypothetical protein
MEAQLPLVSQICTLGTVKDCAVDGPIEFCAAMVTNAAAIIERTAFVYRSTMLSSCKFGANYEILAARAGELGWKIASRRRLAAKPHF